MHQCYSIVYIQANKIIQKTNLVIRCVTDNVRKMVAAMKLQLPSFVNVNEEKESEESIEIEIDAGIELPSYLLIPESEDCLAESEECSDDEELFTLSIAEIPTCSQS